MELVCGQGRLNFELELSSFIRRTTSQAYISLLLTMRVYACQSFGARCPQLSSWCQLSGCMQDIALQLLTLQEVALQEVALLLAPSKVHCREASTY